MTIDELTPTQIATLALLRAQDKDGRENSSIPGRIHLVKELFAVAQTDLGRSLLPELQFEADNYGPFDETVFAALDELEDAGLVETVGSEHRGEIRLTADGRKLAGTIWTRMRDEVKGVIAYVKMNYNHRSSEAVLHEIYAAFPEMARNSQSRVAKLYRRTEAGP